MPLPVPTTKAQALALRELYLLGAQEFAVYASNVEEDRAETADGRVMTIGDRAAELFPIPMVERPRVIQLGDTRFRVVAKQLYYQAGADPEWVPVPLDCDEAFYSSIAGLFAQPNELVPADDA